MLKARSLVRLIRPTQHIKNIVIFIPLFFSTSLFDIEKLFLSILSFCTFSMLASGVYVFNDLIDLENDKKHSTKKFRPIARGEVSKRDAVVLSFTLIAASLLFSFLLINSYFVFVCLTYLSANIFYTLFGKRIPYLELLIVASGFVARFVAGGLAIKVEMTGWIILLIMLVSLLAVISKRKIELDEYTAQKVLFRPVLRYYTQHILNGLILLVSATTFILYSFYMLTPGLRLEYHTNILILTSIPVLIGIARFNFLIFIKGYKENPINILFEDRLLQFSIILWLVSFFTLIYIS